MPDALEIVAKFTADTADLVAGSEKAKGALGGISVESLAMGGAVVAGAGVAIAAIAGMTQAASEDRAEQEKLNKVYENAIPGLGDYTDQINAAIDAGAAKAFSDSEVREGLQSLVVATGDADEANKMLAQAMDLARFANVDLAQASDALAKANEGQLGPLQKLIPGMRKYKDVHAQVAEAAKLSAGAADLFAQSTEGSMAIAQNSFGELGEEIGGAFLPIIDAIVPALIPVIQSLGELVHAVIPPLVAIIKILLPVVTTLIGLFVQVVKFAVQIATAIAKQLEPALQSLGPVLDTVGKAIGGVVDWIKSLLDWIGNAIDAVGRFLDSLNPLKGISLPSISLPFSAPAPAAAASTRSGRSTRQAGVTNVTINTSADPEAVVRALRRWAGNNGGSGTFIRALDRAAS